MPPSIEFKIKPAQAKAPEIQNCPPLVLNDKPGGVIFQLVKTV